MGVLANFLDRRSRTTSGTALSKPEAWFLSFLGLENTKSGATVTEWTALQCSAVFACIRILSETVATVPLQFYRRLDRGKERAYDHPLYDVLHSQANEDMSSFLLRETLQGHLGAWGNAYAEIERNKAGDVMALWPLRPDKTRPKRKGGKLGYETIIGGKGYVLPREKVLHIAGFGFDGLVGYNPIQLARESIGMAAATEEYGARLFANDARPGGYIKHPGRLSKPAQDNLIRTWEERHEGLSNKHRLAVLEEGMEFQTVGIPPQESQFLQTRKFQITEIARWYRMQLHKIGEMDKATFSNIEQQSIEFVVDTMLPWFTRWEAGFLTQLLTRQERKEYFAEFLIEGLLRGETRARFDAYAIARQWGWMSANDVREAENMNQLPDDEGNIYLVPMNMVPASEAAGRDQDATPARARLAAASQRNKKGQGAKIRLKIAQSFERVFADAAIRVVRREKADIMRQAKKMLERSDDEFLIWLEDFYREAPDWMQRIIMPALLSYAEAMQAQAAIEIGSDVEMTPELEAHMQGYAEIWASNYTASSRGQIQSVLRQAIEDGADPLERIEQRLGEWEERRPGKVALNETVEAAGVVTKFVFAAGGILRKRWVNAGSDTCPYCQELDGRVVGIDAPFVGREDTLNSEDGSMRIRKPAYAPPIHRGCVCQIEAD